MAILDPGRTALVDELGELTFGELHDRSNRLADSLRARGVGPGDGVAIMCRNHRGFVDASIAAAKLGADILYLNTAFAGPQLVDVLDRESPKWSSTTRSSPSCSTRPTPGTGCSAGRRLRTTPGRRRPGTVEALIDAGASGDHRAPEKYSRMVILTSGTTGTPKGAPRSEAGIEAATALLSRLPLRSRWRTHIAAPLFHTWGWAHFALAMLLGSTIVLRRKFDPETCLQTLVEEDCDSLVVIPVMLQRIMQLDEKTCDSYDLSKVKVVAASGSALPGDLSDDWMDQFGETSTTSTARPRWPTRPSPPRRTSARPRGRRAGRPSRRW